ncbi:MAG: DUF4956 domain-containing protein [Pedosphaera sp.]|nr:DUF4956 domain-containing protein [Pedosphaera sp.]
MTNWFQQAFQVTPPAGPLGDLLAQLFWRIGIAFVLGGIVAAIYRATHRDEPITPSFPRTLVLMSILISMVTQVIGDNMARAFSLTGALAIVRFRTVVRDTQDTAFVIFAVIVGMAAGADHLWVAIVGAIVIGTAILIMRPRRRVSGWSEEECDLSLRLPVESEPEALLAPIFQKHVLNFEVRSVGTAKKGASLELNYRLRLRDGARPFELISELNKIEGVESVDLSRAEES